VRRCGDFPFFATDPFRPQHGRQEPGTRTAVAANGDVLASMLEPPTKLVIIDLNARNQPLATLARVRATQKDLRVVAFLSHVQTELATEARAAGATDVMPRSAFTQNLATILQAAKD